MLDTANADAWFQEDRMEILIAMLVFGSIPMVAAILSDKAPDRR